MREPDFGRAKSLLGSELRLFVIEIAENGLDEDTAEYVSDRAKTLISELDAASSEGALGRIESDLGRLQIVVRQGLKRQKKGT